MAPPPVQLLQPGHHQRSPPTSSGAHQQQQQPPQPGYPTFPVGPLGEIDAKRRRVDDGVSPSRRTVAYQAQQQQQPLGYPTQQYQSQTHTHWYGSGAQPTNAPVSQPSQATYGYSPASSVGPSYSQHTHAVRAPTRHPSMYAAPILTAPSQWTSGGSTQGQRSPGAAAHLHPTQVYQQLPYTSPAHATGAHQVHTPAGSSKSGPGLPISPMTPVPFPLNATVPLVTGPLSSPAGSKGGAAGPSVPASAVGSQVPHRGGSAQGQEQYFHSSGPTPYQQPEQMQPHPQQLYNSPTYATPAEVVSLANAPSFHIPPWTNPTASGENPNSGAGPSGSNVNIAGTSGEPLPLNQQIGPNRSNRTNWRQLSKPYQRPTSAPCKTRPIPYERNLVRLQQRCKRQGADEGAIGLLGKIFTNEVSLEALIRLLTDTEAETKEFGIDNGKVYNALLGYLNEEDSVVPRYHCRLCHSEQTWKHHRDVLRHLRRDHFGLANVCDQWCVFDRSLM